MKSLRTVGTMDISRYSTEHGILFEERNYLKRLSVGWMSVATILVLFCSALGNGMLLLSYCDSDIAGPPGSVDVPAETQVEIVNMTTNHFAGGGFEDWSTPYYLSYFDESSQTRERYSWYASSPWPVSEGSHSAGLQCRTSDVVVPTAAYLRQYFDATAKNLTVDFDWWLENNPNPTLYACYIYAQMGFNSGKSIEYYISGVGISGNSTSRGAFLLGGPDDAWNEFSRNVTHDYLSITQFGGTLPESLTMTSFGVYAYSHGVVTDFLRVFIDDVHIINGTTTYVGGSTQNGDFETHSGYSWWEFNANRGYGALTQSSAANGGSWSMNHTVRPDGNISYANVLNRAMIRLSEANPGILSLWYNIPEWTMASEATYSRVGLELDTGSGNYYAYYYICSGGAGPAYTNGTTQAVFAPPGYNQTGQWTYMERNVWEDLSTYFGFQEIRINWLTVSTWGTNLGSSLTILIDDLSLSSAFLNDGGYEDQGASGSNIRGYETLSGAFAEDTHLTVTETSYTGSKAANLTIPESYAFSCVHFMAYQRFVWIPYPDVGIEELYLDCQWRLEDAIESAPGSARLTVRSLDSKEISYIFSRNQTDSLTNTTQQGFISVDGFNTEDTWLYMHRDLAHDYEAVFGYLPDTRITYVYLQANTIEADTLTLLLDEVYMYADSSPRVSDVGHSPLSPEPTESVQVLADVVDVSVDTVLLCYRVNGGTWQEATMNLQTGSTYVGEIPAQEYDASVEYYVSANDTYGWVSAYPAGMSYLTYTVDDTTDPLLNILTPENNSEVVDIFDLTVEASDTGSGLAFVEIYGDSGLLTNESAAVFVCHLDMTELPAGICTFRIYAYDVAGNMAYARICVNLTHAVTTTTTTTTATTTTTPAGTTTTTPTTTTAADLTMLLIAALGGGFVAAIVVSLFVARRRRAAS